MHFKLIGLTLISSFSLFGGSPIEPHESVQVRPGRIVLITDGNAHDPDDIIGTPVALALLQASGLESRLVSACHSSELTNKKIFDQVGGEQEQLLRQKMNQFSFDKYVRVWGGYDELEFWNCRVPEEYVYAVEEIRLAINASSSNDPPWVIEAGEPDVLYDAIKQSHASKLQFVTVVTHHVNNDMGSDPEKSLGKIQEINQPKGIKVIRISANEWHGQNVNLKTGLEQWHWARDHGDRRLAWLYKRGVFAGNHAYGDIRFKYSHIAGKFDCSDAGMMFWWLTGNEKGTPADCRDILIPYIETTE